MILVAAANSSDAAKAMADFVADGVDDQVEINAAIQALGGNPGTVRLLDGDYNLGASTSTAAIVIAQSNITLQGESWATRLHLQDNANVNMIRSVGDGLEHIIVENLWLDGNAANNSSGDIADRFEHNIIRIMPDGDPNSVPLHHDVWVRNIHAEDGNRLAVMLGGNDMHVRNSEFGIVGSDVVEVLYGTGSDISDNVAHIYGETGYVFGSDAASGVSIRNNTTHVYDGGRVTEAVHRTWGGQYYNQITGNTILIETGGEVARAVEARGYQNLISNNLIVAPGNGEVGRTTVEINGGTLLANNFLINTDIVINTTASDFPIFIDGNQGYGVAVPTLEPSVVLGQNSFFGPSFLSNNDTLVGTSLADVLQGGAGFDSIDGGDGDDTLSGGGDKDVLVGGLGNDVLDGGREEDTLAGGPGNDTYVVDSVGDVVDESLDGGIDTVRTDVPSYALGSNLENLTYTGADAFSGTGNDLNNVITGSSGSDSLTGRGGNDTLNGSSGNDNLIGGAGNDLYFVTDSGDVVIEHAGEGTSDEIRTVLASYTLPSDVEVLRFIGAGSFAGSGNDGANTIYGGAGTDTLTGGAGADTLNGGAGSDTASYASATAKVFVDLMTGGTLGDAAGDTFTSIENVTGSNYNDQLFADAVDNVLIGLDGDDVIYGRVGDDTLDGGNGNDLLNGAEGMDQLTGGNGFDTASYFFAATGVTVDLDTGGTAGEALGDIYSSIERVLGSDTAGDELSGTAGTDQLRGLGGNDRLFGKDGYDILSGDAGDDEINGGGGNDDLRGDAGSDTFFFAANFGADVVRDFDADPTDGQDLIDLSSFGVTSATYDAAVLSGLLVISSTGAGGTLITVNDTAGGHTGSINLLNVALTNISASDFIT